MQTSVDSQMSQATASSEAPSSSQATSRYDGPESDEEETLSDSSSSSGSRKRGRAAKASEPREKRARRDPPSEWTARLSQLERRIGQVERYELEASRAHYRIMAAEARVRVGAREFLDTMARVKNASEDLQAAESRMNLAEMHAHDWKTEIKRCAKSADAYVAEINEAAILIEAARPDPARCWRRALGPVGFPLLVGGFTAAMAAFTGCANPASAGAQMASASVLLGWYPRC